MGDSSGELETWSVLHNRRTGQHRGVPVPGTSVGLSLFPKSSAGLCFIHVAQLIEEYLLAKPGSDLTMASSVFDYFPCAGSASLSVTFLKKLCSLLVQKLRPGCVLLSTLRGNQLFKSL